jgi:peptidoglycan hydrolase CwlO-like protein
MKKLLILGFLGAVALVAIGKTTSAWSYVNTAVCQVGAGAKSQVPTKFELERIRNEIGALDGDISQMIRPIAEYKSVIERMRKDIARSQTNIDKQKKTLLEVVTELQENPKHITINDRTYTPEQIRRQVTRDTESLKQLEKHVKIQHQVLEAKELSLKATQEQLAKVISKKREYEVRLAQLEAEEETLQLASVGNDVKIDNTRASLIEDALNAVEQRQDVTRKVNELRTGELANINLQERNRTPADLSTIRSYLEGAEAAQKTADNK